MIVLAGAFATFMGYVLLGLLALPVTAMLNKSLGKEKALLLWSAVILLITVFGCQPEGPGRGVGQAGREDTIPAADLVSKGDPFSHAAYDHDAERNIFEPYSDTRELPPIALDAPPWIPLEFALPPTIPGPAPGFRQVLRGARPVAAGGDGTGIASIPVATFVDYERKPEDVFDWVLNGGKPYYIYILAIQADGGKWHEEGTTGYERLKWVLKGAGEGFEKLRVKAGLIGFEEKAQGVVADLDIIGVRQKNETEKGATEQADGWYLRRTVANLYYEALLRQGLEPTKPLAEQKDPDRLRRAAKDMAAVGATGKEAKEGWRRAAALIEAALVEIRINRGAAERSEALLELLAAYKALRDEQAVLRILAEYMQTAPASAEARTWLGELHLQGMQLADEALLYFRAALERDGRHAPALIGEGDALTFAGEHKLALTSYRKAASDEGRLRLAFAHLRVGDLDAARTAAESLISRDPGNMGATLARACVLYALGGTDNLGTARSAFEAVATSDDSQELRAQACYNLGLTCLRLGQPDAATEAFVACESALGLGSSSGPTPDETVSPSLGRALVAYATGDDAAMRAYLERARGEASRSSYVEMFAGVVASLDQNDASAIRALDAALRNAPMYAELDGWLAKTYLRLGASAVATGDDPKNSAATFEKAVAFANRAADREEGLDKNAYEARLREALVRAGAQHLPSRQRYQRALDAATKVLNNSTLREQPAALAIAGYCQYQLGDYRECIRRLQSVLDVVAAEDTTWSTWREYAEKQLKAVKHWMSLEEKTVAFQGLRLDREWDQGQAGGVTLLIEDEVLRFVGRANKDGNFLDPIAYAKTTALFERDSFEELTMTLRIPREKDGRATNNVTFGVQVGAEAGSGSGGAKRPGLGIFYDRNKIAVRIQGGQIKRYKEGDVTRLEPAMDWPEGDEVELRIVRLDANTGAVAVYLNGELIIEDQVSAFKASRGKAMLWIGGYSTQEQEYDVQVRDIRVVRRKAQ
ncbi:MAG: tetratricopeptide repeat protein [Planctomycetota bacterium]|nr:tetratricopeptide repeat protein [Planctomycetota bacterium]